VRNRWIYWEKEVFFILLSGLKRLEYRGYESFGFCVFNNRNDSFLHKKVGKISEAENKLLKLEVEGNIGIAHIR
jgi:glucosamine--fructose-6-phosphate aminotransferase (isomerizing)